MKGLIFLCIIFISNWGMANEATTTEALILRADNLGLAQHPVWHKLVHYERQTAYTSQVRSAIHDRTFFNADNGKTSPADELHATLRALLEPQNKNAQQHAQCRFPARYLWLKKQLQLRDSDLPLAKCPDFEQWTFNNSVQSISLVYASGYLGNPATYYGHTLLKLNSAGKRKQTNLLDQSVNYGVILPDNENPVSYITKSLFGGYDGGFSKASYHFHTQNYGEIELRDLWEYELNLNQDEVDFVVAHAWEVLGKRYTYYFFQENCAYRLAELLEIVDDVEVIPSNPIFTLPRTVLQKMATGTRSDSPLIRSINFHPSRQSRLYIKFSSLTPEQKLVVYDISQDISYLKSKSYESLPTKSKQIVLDTLLDYYQFSEKADVLPVDEIDNYYNQILKERFTLAPGNEFTRPPIMHAPHRGRKASRLSFGLTNNHKLGEGLSILLRPTYYDVLDADSGHVSDSALAMGEIKIFASDDLIKIRHVDIFKIKSVNHGITGLYGDNGKAWKLKMGLQQQNLSCWDCLTLKFEGDYGITSRPHRNFLIGSFLGAGVQDNRKSSGNLFIKASIFSHLQLTDHFNMLFLAETPKQIDGSGGGENYYSLEARYRLGINTDVRFLYEEKDSAEYSVSLGYYF